MTSSAVQVVVWPKRYLENLKIVLNAEKSMTVYCERMSAIAYAKNLKYLRMAARTHIRHSFMEELCEKKVTSIYLLGTCQPLEQTHRLSDLSLIHI